jgi:hypothetical protein
LTLDTAATFLAAAALRATGFLALTAGFGLAEVFLAARDLPAALRASGLAAVALVALGLDGDFALTARFVLFAVCFAFERDVDRLKPFVRLLLMCGNLKRLLTPGEQPWNCPAAYHRHTSKSTETSICGCFIDPELGPISDTSVNKEKHLMVIVGYVKVHFGLRRLNPPRQTAPTEEETSFSFKNLQSAEQAFQVFTLQETSRPGLQ